MRTSFAVILTLLVSLFSTLAPVTRSEVSHRNRIHDKWNEHHGSDKRTTHKFPDNAFKLSGDECSKTVYCNSGKDKKAHWEFDPHHQRRKKRVVTYGQGGSSSNITIYLPDNVSNKNSTCFTVYESCECDSNTKNDMVKMHLEFLNVKRRTVELMLNDREMLSNFFIYPNSFKLCNKNEDANLKALKHCQTDFQLKLESNKGPNTQILGINSDNCVPLPNPKHGSIHEKMYIVHYKNFQKDAFTCVEAFSERDCTGGAVRIVVPNAYTDKDTDSKTEKKIWDYSAKKKAVFDIKSVRKCSYCRQDSTTGDIADNSKSHSVPKQEPQQGEQQSEEKEPCVAHNCIAIPNLFSQEYPLDLYKDCYFYFNNTNCNGKPPPIVQESQVNLAQLNNLLGKFPKFGNWTIAECGDHNERMASPCAPHRPGLGIEQVLKESFPKKPSGPSDLELVLLYVVGSIALIMFIVVVVMSFMLWRKKKRIREIRQRCVPNKRFGPHHQPRNVNVHQMDRIEENDYVSDITGLRALCASFADGYEIPRDHINIGNMRDSTANIIGVGEFSIAFKGQLEPRGKTVAVKTMKTGQATTRTIKGALRECQIFKQLGKHPGILEFFGVSTENASKGEIFIVMAFCEKGSLRGFLAQQKSHFVSLVQDGEWVNDESLKTVLESKLFIENGPPVKFNTIQLFKWCLEIADAMEFLAIRKIVHVSLSARNVLLDEKFSCKISDFHLAKVPGDVIPSGAFSTLTKTNMYKQERLVPWRWYAIESLMDDVFSTQSDVWAFGIVMWEIFSLGATPYQEYSYGSEFTLCIKHGYRLQTPNFATVECYQLMLMCWFDAPEKRPTFTKLKSKLAEMIPDKNTPISPGPFQVVRSLSKSS